MLHENLTNVLRMVLADNKGQVLTEALCFGMEHMIVSHMRVIEQAEQRAVALSGGRDE